MRLLIVVPDQDRATGNWVTANRLQQGLAARGHTLTVVSTAGGAAALGAAAIAAAPDLVLLLHAWHSGRPWLAAACPYPYAVLLTGTDVNVGMTDPSQAPVIAQVLRQAAAILTQNPATAVVLRRDLPALAARIHHLPPGILLGDAACSLPASPAPAPGEALWLCPAGVRPVKGVVELLEMCDPLVREGCRLRLLCCGPLLDDAYGRRFLAAVAARPWASYAGVVPPPAMPALFRRADLVVSNAFSEGLPNALVEAATLGRPVLARNISGNAAVITHGVNGLLFDDTAGFHAAGRRLLNEPALRAALSRPDPGRFNADDETAALEAICRSLLAKRAVAATAGQPAARLPCCEGGH